MSGPASGSDSAERSTRCPPDVIRARVRSSYDAIAETYSQWSRAQAIPSPREDMVRRLLHSLRKQTPSPSPSPSPSPLSSLTAVSTQPAGHYYHDDDDDDDGDKGDKDAGQRGWKTKPPRALDLGCGEGLPVIKMLLDSGLAVRGVDGSATQLSQARAHFRDAPDGPDGLCLEQRDMVELVFPPAEFDAVVALYSLIHLPRGEQGTMLGRIRGWLRPGGLALLNFPAVACEEEVDERWLGQDRGWMYWSGWGEAEMRDRVRAVGMEVLYEQTVDEGEGGKFWWVIARKK